MKVFELAQELKLSTRTITRRFNILMQNNTFYILPVIDIKSFKGRKFFANTKTVGDAEGMVLAKRKGEAGLDVFTEVLSEGFG